MRKEILVPLVFLGCLWIPQFVQAHESLFGYSYTTDTLPKGRWEFEQSTNGKYGKNHGSYVNSLFRTEVEYGVTDNFQSAFYVNSRHVYANKNNHDGTTGGENIPDLDGRRESYNKFKFETISLEFIKRILSPYTHPIGFALYLEPAWGPDKYSIEPKLIFQKNFLEDRLVLAVNNTWEIEWEKEIEAEEGEPEKKDWEKEMEFENTIGLSYRFADRWFGGVEFRNHNEFSSFSLRDIEHNAYFLGPNVHYASKNFWWTGTVLFQLPFAKGYTTKQQNVIDGGKIFGKEHESVEFRLKLGWNF